MQTDPWESGNPYDFFMGRWSRPVAYEFLEWLSMTEQLRWLDVGCGTGVLSSSIIEVTAPQEVLAVDASDTFIAFAQQTYKDTRLRFHVGDARKLPAKTGYFDVVVSGLALNFIPAPIIALTEMVRTIRTGGVVAGYVWDYAEKMQMLRHFWDAAIAIDPLAKELDEGDRFPLCQRSALEALFQEAGLKNVETWAIDVPTIFRDFDDYWSPFLGGQGPAPGYAMSLSNEQRKALEEQLKAVLPVLADGAIALIARAWAVRGVV
ncbi:MAG: methyltransferase domain-containing protein [Ignavibacterium sp.]|nr:MAG: methyltransferase domain-containing protein [Ignavibacterium sp.]